MNTFGERFLYAIKHSDLKNVSRFARSIGVTNVTLYRIIDGKNEPSKKIIDAIFESFQIEDAVWVLTGQRIFNKYQAENKALKEKVTFLEEKVNEIAKFSRNRKSPCSPIAYQTELNMQFG